MPLCALAAGRVRLVGVQGLHTGAFVDSFERHLCGARPDGNLHNGGFMRSSGLFRPPRYHQQLVNGQMVIFLPSRRGTFCSLVSNVIGDLFAMYVVLVKTGGLTSLLRH